MGPLHPPRVGYGGNDRPLPCLEKHPRGAPPFPGPLTSEEGCFDSLLFTFLLLLPPRLLVVNVVPSYLILHLFLLLFPPPHSCLQMLAIVVIAVAATTTASSRRKLVDFTTGLHIHSAQATSVAIFLALPSLMLRLAPAPRAFRNTTGPAHEPSTCRLWAL